MIKKEFKSLSDFSKYISKIPATYLPVQAIGLELLGEYLVEESKAKIGFLQSEHGPFSAWAPLAESTIADKQRKGYDFNDDHNPLFRTGELQESIEKKVLPDMLSVGSTSEIMIYQEMGTKTIPARSVLGSTMFQEKEKIELAVGQFLKSWMTGEAQKGILK